MTSKPKLSTTSGPSIRHRMRSTLLQAQLRAIALYDRVVEGEFTPPTNWITRNACASAGLFIEMDGELPKRNVIIVDDSVAAVTVVAAMVENATIAFVPKQTCRLDRSLAWAIEHCRIEVPQTKTQLAHMTQTKRVLISPAQAREFSVAAPHCVRAEVTLPRSGQRVPTVVIGFGPHRPTQLFSHLA